MIILDVEQGSKAWKKARTGVLSASNFSKIITSKGKKSATFKSYAIELAAEQVTNERIEIFQNKAMTRGIEMEAEARNAYELISGNKTSEVGLVYLNEDKKISCSPDGLIDKVGLEIKCPQQNTHAKYLLDDKLPTAYFQQVQGSLFVTGFKAWDFMSYHPLIKPLIIEVERDEDFISKLSVICDEFISLVYAIKINIE